MIKRTQDEFNGLDILVNNVGIQFVSPIQDFPEEKWDAIMDVCLNSAFHSTKAALPYMLKQKWGRIINTGSMHAKVASPYKSAYNAAKHGIAGLTKTVGLEVAQKGNITCNCICPGYVLTDLIKNQLKDTAKARGIPEVSHSHSTDGSKSLPGQQCICLKKLQTLYNDAHMHCSCIHTALLPACASSRHMYIHHRMLALLSGEVHKLYELLSASQCIQACMHHAAPSG